MDDLTEKEINLVCLAATYDKDTAKRILKGTGLSLRNNVIYRGDKEVGTAWIEQHGNNSRT